MSRITRGVKKFWFVPLIAAGNAIAMLFATLFVGCDARSPTQPAAPGGNGPVLMRMVDSKELPPSAAGTVGSWSAVSQTFNDKSIGAGSTLWFSSTLRLKSSALLVPFTLYMDTATATYIVNGVSTVVSLPNAQVNFDATATSVTTRFDQPTYTWITTVPLYSIGTKTVFLSGGAFPVPGGLPAKTGPVTWQARFSSSVPGIAFNWSWSATPYSVLGDYTTLDVKPCDDSRLSAWANSDKAGTPERYKQNVTPGACGNGGTNYTGDASQTFDLVMSSAIPAASSVTQTIDHSSGGTITAGIYTLAIPAGALRDDTTITLTPDPTGLVECNMEPSGLTFEKPYTLAFSYANTTADPSSPVYVKGKLSCVWFDPSTSLWTPIGGTDNTKTLTYTATSDHFSYYALAK